MQESPDVERRALISVAQAKLTVGAVSDPFEREADRVADRVMAIVQRLGTQPMPAAEVDTAIQPATRIRRHVGHHHAEVGVDGGDLSAEMSSRIQRTSGGGEPLSAGIRAPMESAFGASFADVRVHTNSEIAPHISATAFTVGSDIHFAPGAYRPAERSGQWLLGHELTHVVQQNGASTEADGSCVHRHASKEHYLLGSMTPEQIRTIADAKARVAAGPGSGLAGKFKVKFLGAQRPQPAALYEALLAVQEQITALEHWRDVTGPDDPDPMIVNKGRTEYNHHWGGQLVTVRCRDGELVCTVGELNALPDFFGSFDDIARVDRSILFKTMQVIRRESYVYLKGLEAQMQNRSYSYDKKGEAFTGIEDNNVSLPAHLPDVANNAIDVLQTASMLKSGNGEVGLDTSIGAEATLGRNACHFPPESWLRWRDHHQRARALVASATSLNDLADKGNEAIALNAFGEHYLQDSYASGHLINKGFVMAVAMEHVTQDSRTKMGLTPRKIRALQLATAHREAYKVPKAAKDKLDDVAGGRPARANVLDDQNLKARDPQSALEAARQGGGNAATRKRAEVAASGLDPNSMSFEQFRAWLNDFWIQKITNTLHDKYCVNGLDVSSPDQRNLFKIYGDSNMMRSGEGAAYTAETSMLSREAINTLIKNKRTRLTPPVPGQPVIPPRPVTSTEKILSRFPDKVSDGGVEMSLEDWATGAPMRRQIAEVVDALSAEFWKEGKVTALVRLASIKKPVAAGLKPDHGPF